MAEEVVEYQEPTAEELELEKKIELLTQARINLKVTPVVFDRLQKQAEFHGVTIEEHCAQILQESLKHTVGKAHITGPTNLSTDPHTRVSGPIGDLVTRVGG